MKRIFNKYQVIVICVFLVFSTLVVYRQVLYSDFCNFDDPIYVSKNPHVTTGLTRDSIGWAFTSRDVSYWHPLTWLSHMLDCELFGLKAGMHHLTNLILHIANVLLLFLVLNRMTGSLWKSAFVGAVFALHPLNVDSVAWISERKNVLSTLFWLLTMLSYTSYAHRGGAKRYILTLLLFALGLLAKPMLVTLPFVMLLLDYWPLGRYRSEEPDNSSATKTSKALICSHRGSPFFRLIVEKVPFFVLAGVSIFLFSSSAYRPGIEIPLEVRPFGLRIANALVSYTAYIGKMVWPRGLAVFYPFPEMVPMWKTIVALLMLVCVSAAAIFLSRKRPYILIGWLWYLGTLIPVIGLFQVGLWPAMADRWGYVPLIGLFIIIAWGGGDLAGKWRLRKSMVALGAGVCLSALMVCTWFQTGYWHNGFTLFTHALEVTRNNHIAHFNLGNVLLKQNRNDEAITHYKKTIGIVSDYAEAHYHLGIALSAAKRYAEAIDEYYTVLRLRENHTAVLPRLAEALARNGQAEEAISYYNKALQQKPNDTKILNNFALVLVKQGAIDEAIGLYEKSLEINPDSVEVLNNLGNALIRQKKFVPAVMYFKKAVSLQPGFAEGHYNLARALNQTGHIEEAIASYREAIRLKPDDRDAHYGLGLTLVQAQRYDEAAVCYEKAIRLDRMFAPAYYNLGLIFVYQNKAAKAIEQFREVLRIHPNSAEMHCNLGILLAQEGLFDEAVKEFRTSLRLDPNFSKAREQLDAVLERSAKPNTPP